MLTLLGRKLRTYRMEKNINLGVMADHAQVSSAYLSAVEHGKKNATPLLLSRIAEYLGLQGHEIKELEMAAHASKSEHRIAVNNSDPSNRELVSMFARSIENNSLTADQSERIKQILDELLNKQ